MTDFSTGKEMFRLIERLYPICRSITGNGVRETLSIIGEHIPLEVREVPAGTQVFDWTVPKEWNIRDAYVKDPSGEKVVDFRKSNLHVVNYSVPVGKKVALSELREHLHTLPEFPDRIPYRTSYYRDSWGFCMAHSAAESLTEGEYEVRIDSSLKDGHLTYGECFLPGETEQEVLFSCHVCHPSLCNDNLSSVAVVTALARLLATNEKRFSYRLLFVPGTIGAIAWLARNREQVNRIRHGMVLAGVGDRGKVHYKLSRRSDAEIDRIARLVLRDSGEPHAILPFTPYGYDERQYCSPGFNLPVGCFMRTPHGTYPEYHTSADNLDFVAPEALQDSYRKIAAIVDVIEADRVYLNTNPYCEPQLGKRGLYRHMGGTNARESETALLWVLNLSDGEHSLVDISERSGMSFANIRKAAELLRQHDLLSEKPLAK